VEFSGCFAEMAPKVNTGKGCKRKAGEALISRRPSRPAQFDGTRFLSAAHQERFNELTAVKLWHDKQFVISPTGKYNGLASIIERRRWQTLVNPHPKINVDIVREFYANALPIDDEDGSVSERNFAYTTFVRGRRLRFDREAINTYLGNPMPLRDPNDLCEFHRKQNSGNWDHEEIQRMILKEGKSYVKSTAGRPHLARKSDMTTPAQVILRLILHNIRPKSHISSTTLDVTPLIYFILAARQVDVARIISWELKTIALSGRLGPKCPLGFPGLILGLVLSQRIPLPDQIHEELTHPIDDAFIDRYLNDAKKGKSTSGASTSRQPPVTPTSQPLDYTNFDPRFRECFTYSWDQQDASFRAMTELQNSMYRMQVHSGLPNDEALRVMAPDAFQTHVAWPGVRPFYGGGGSAPQDDVGEGQGEGDDEVFSANSSGGDDGDDEMDEE
jgi:hypothetical protein